MVFAICLMYCVFKYTVNVMIQSQRMDSIYRGPLNSGLSHIVIGLVSVRAYERIDHFRNKFIDDLEKSCNVTFTYFTVNRLMGFMLDFSCLSFTAAVTIFTLLVYVDPAKNAQLAFAL